MAKQYKIRMHVLNLELAQWRNLSELRTKMTGKWDAKCNEPLQTTAEEFLREIGIPGGKAAFFNDEERAFFNEMSAMVGMMGRAAA